VRYALRPPIAQERLHILPNDLVRIELSNVRFAMARWQSTSTLSRCFAG